MLRCQIRRLADVDGKIVELRRLLGQVHEFPSSLAHGAQLAAAPKQSLVRRADFLARKIREQIHAVVFFIRRHRRTRRSECRGKHVDRTHRPVVCAARGDFPGPRNEKRHAYAALVDGALRRAQRSVVGSVRGQRSSVVAKEKHQRLLPLSRLSQRAERLADRVIHQTHLRRVGAPFRISDGRKPREAFGGGLVRRVRSVKRQIEKPRLTLMPPHKRRRLAPEGLRQMRRGLHRHAVALDRHGVFDRRVRLPLAKFMAATNEAKRFLKPPLTRRKLRRRPEVPLSDPTGHVARPHQMRRQQRLRGRQSFGVIARIVKRIPLVTKPLLIAPRHEPSPRGTTKRVGHITARKPHPRLRQPIQMRRRNFLRPLKPRIRVTLVVGYDHQHVRSPRFRCHRQR